MTPDEYREALAQLSDERFLQFQQGWGGAKNRDRTACVREFSYADNSKQVESIIVSPLRQLGVSLKTESEKSFELAARQAESAEASAGGRRWRWQALPRRCGAARP